MRSVNNIELYIEIDDCWVGQCGPEFYIGLLPSTMDKIGNVTFVDRIPIGKILSKGAIIGILETSKLGDWPLKSPVNALVLAFNDKLNKNPSLCIASDMDENWIVKCKVQGISTISDLGEAKTR